MTRPRIQSYGQPLRRHRRSSAAQKDGAATTVIRGVTTVRMAAPGVVAPGVAAAMVEVAVVTVGVAAPTTAAEGTAVVETEEA